MTASQSETGADEASGSTGDDQLSQEFANRGFVLVPASADPPSFEGAPLSAVGFAPAGTEEPARIAAAVLAGDGLDAFDLTVAAIQAANLDLAPASAVSINSLDELTATVAHPLELLAIRSGDQIIGVVARHADRRAVVGYGTTVGTIGGDGADGAVAGGGAVAQPDPVPSAASGQSATPGSAPSGSFGLATGLGLLQDVVLEVTVELGQTALPLARLMSLGIGSVVELDRNAGAPVDVLVNGTLFAKGEVVVVDGEYAVRIIEILAPPSQ